MKTPNSISIFSIKYILEEELMEDKFMCDCHEIESTARRVSRGCEDDVEIWHYPNYDRPRRLCIIRYKKK